MEDRITRFIIIVSIVLICLPVLFLFSKLYESETGYFFNISSYDFNFLTSLFFIGISLAVVGILIGIGRRR